MTGGVVHEKGLLAQDCKLWNEVFSGSRMCFLHITDDHAFGHIWFGFLHISFNLLEIEFIFLTSVS